MSPRVFVSHISQSVCIDGTECVPDTYLFITGSGTPLSIRSTSWDIKCGPQNPGLVLYKEHSHICADSRFLSRKVSHLQVLRLL